MKTRDKVLEFLQGEIQWALDQIQRNIDTMKDSKGRTKLASTRINRGVYGYNGSPVKEQKTQFKVTIRMEEYAMFVDKGVRGALTSYASSMGSPYSFKNKMPPIEGKKGYGIKSWMRHRGIVPRDEKGRKLPFSQKATDKMAWLIARKIYRHGIEAVNFYSSVINIDFTERIFKGLERAGEEGIRNDLDSMWVKHAMRVTQDSEGNIVVKVN